jgi:hypothetical protein
MLASNAVRWSNSQLVNCYIENNLITAWSGFDKMVCDSNIQILNISENKISNAILDSKLLYYDSHTRQIKAG